VIKSWIGRTVVIQADADTVGVPLVEATMTPFDHIPGIDIVLKY
jgi:hypothetical protein